MKLKLSLLLVVSCSVVANAQMETIRGAGNAVMMDNKYTDIEGSAYLYDDFKQGKIVDRAGNATDNVMIRFDLFKQEIEILQDGANLRIDKNAYPQFAIYQVGVGKDLTTNVFRSGFKHSDILFTDYCEVLSDGKTKLIRKRRVEMVSEMSQSYGTSGQVRKFEKKGAYYIVLGDAIKKVKLSKSDFLEALADKRAQLEEFIKSNKLKFKNDEDFITLLNHFDQL